MVKALRDPCYHTGKLSHYEWPSSPVQLLNVLFTQKLNTLLEQMHRGEEHYQLDWINSQLQIYVHYWLIIYYILFRYYLEVHFPIFALLWNLKPQIKNIFLYYQDISKFLVLWLLQCKELFLFEFRSDLRHYWSNIGEFTLFLFRSFQQFIKNNVIFLFGAGGMRCAVSKFIMPFMCSVWERLDWQLIRGCWHPACPLFFWDLT